MATLVVILQEMNISPAIGSPVIKPIMLQLKACLGLVWDVFLFPTLVVILLLILFA